MKKQTKVKLHKDDIELLADDINVLEEHINIDGSHEYKLEHKTVDLNDDEVKFLIQHRKLQRLGLI